MEGSPASMAPLLLRNLITSLFVLADKPFLTLAERYKILEILHTFIVGSFLFFLRLLPSVLFYPANHLAPGSDNKLPRAHHRKPDSIWSPPGGTGDSGIARALSQLLSIVNTVPVSSRKYEAVRSLAELLIDENQQAGTQELRDVNRTVLSAAFSRTLAQLEVAMMEQERNRGGIGFVGGPQGSPAMPVEYYYNLNRVVRLVRTLGDAAWNLAMKPKDVSGPEGSSAEKLAAELVWLAQKLAACGCAEEAVGLWASASNLAWLAISAEARLQGLLVKVSAFLFKQARDMGIDQTDATVKEEQRLMKMRMLMAWLPLLCRASNGTDVPVLTLGERAELEKVLDETIGMLNQEEEQEQVLSQWLHHFMYCASSDWPNLHSSYTRWCDASRKLLLKPVNADRIPS